MKIRFNIKEHLSFKDFTYYKKLLDKLFDEYDIQILKMKLPEFGFRFLGHGSFRVVYAFPDNVDLVLKIVDDKRDAAMNKREVDARIQTKYSSILPKMYLAGKDYLWIVVEKVEPEPSFQAIKDKLSPDLYLSLDLSNFLIKVKRYASEFDIKKAIKLAMQDRAIDSITPTMHKIIDYIIEYDVNPNELRRDNLGISHDGRLVIIDSSFEQDLNND